MKTARSAHEILHEMFKLKKEKNRRFSIRVLARMLDLSPGFVSKMLHGKKAIPVARLEKLIEALEMDRFQVRRFKAALASDFKIIDSINEELLSEPRSASIPSLKYNPVPARTFPLLDNWYNIAIMDLVDCHDFKASPAWIAERLGLDTKHAEKAWHDLKSLGCVKQSDEGRWIKVQEKCIFPNTQVHPQILRHHRSMLEKASEELQQHQSAEDFKRRLILGASVSTNEKSFLKAKAFLEEALCKAGDILSEGTADQVYYLAFQVFPLTAPPPKNPSSQMK